MSAGQHLAGYLVIWRPGPRGVWEAQPRMHVETAAEILAKRLQAEFGGQVALVPVILPEFPE